MKLESNKGQLTTNLTSSNLASTAKTDTRDEPKYSGAASDADIFSQGFQRFSAEIERRQLSKEPEILMILSSLNKLASAAEKTSLHFHETGENSAALELNPWLFGMNHNIFTRDILITDLMYLLELRDPAKAKSLAEVINIGSRIKSDFGSGRVGNFASFLGIAHEELEDGFPAYRKIFRREDPDRNSILPSMGEILKQRDRHLNNIDSFVNGTMALDEKISFTNKQFIVYSQDEPTIMPSYCLASNLEKASPAQYATLRQEYLNTRALRLATLMAQAEKINQRKIYSDPGQHHRLGLIQKTLALFKKTS